MGSVSSSTLLSEVNVMTDGFTLPPYALQEGMWILYRGLLPGWEKFGEFEVRLHLYQVEKPDWFVMAVPLEDVRGFLSCLTLVGDKFTHLNEEHFFASWNDAIQAFEKATSVKVERQVA